MTLDPAIADMFPGFADQLAREFGARLAIRPINPLAAHADDGLPLSRGVSGPSPAVANTPAGASSTENIA